MLWALRIPSLKQDQVDVAKRWLSKVSEEVNKLEFGTPRDVRDVITLKEDRTVGWTKDDEKWDTLMKLEKGFSSPVRSNL